jgi:hypothetical protein
MMQLKVQNKCGPLKKSPVSSPTHSSGSSNQSDTLKREGHQETAVEPARHQSYYTQDNYFSQDKKGNVTKREDRLRIHVKDVEETKSYTIEIIEPPESKPLTIFETINSAVVDLLSF